MNEDKNTLKKIIKAGPALTNSIRRIMMSEVPVMAIEDVHIVKNTSAMYDEILAHRLGLVPLITDLKTYNLPEECKCKGKGCGLCQAKFKLSVKGPMLVTAKELVPSDSKILPVFPGTIITNLLEDQELELEATAVLGKGKKHAKWSPCLAVFQGYPVVKINKDDKAAVEACPVNLYEFKNKKLVFDNKRILDCTLCQACVEATKGNVTVEPDPEKQVLTIESWGQLEPEEIYKKAVEILSNKIQDFEKQIK